MLRTTKGGFLALLLFSGCSEEANLFGNEAVGGGYPALTLPFPSGEYWQLTQGPNTGSHTDYGFLYGDDTFALDFSQSGCEPYGKIVTPMAEGYVMEVREDGENDQGYGNTILIDHGNGYVSRYAHLAEILVDNPNEHVDVEEPIGTVGDTGHVSGTVCGEHPGTHLHVALYQHQTAVEIQYLSGISTLETGCWYNREGDENCGSNPGDYEADEGSSNGDVEILYMQIVPWTGSASETDYVWTSIVESPDKPETTLWIENPNDGELYDFTMTTESEQSPWVFTYRKTLRDPTTYTYWVKSTDGNDWANSEIEETDVDNKTYDEPILDNPNCNPDEGESDKTTFTWTVDVWSDEKPTVHLYVVNPEDAMIYSFYMNVEDDGSNWRAEYSKTLRDATVYTYWMGATNDESSSNSEVNSMEVED